jgi:hypothetical protein
VWARDPWAASHRGQARRCAVWPADHLFVTQQEETRSGDAPRGLRTGDTLRVATELTSRLTDVRPTPLNERCENGTSLTSPAIGPAPHLSLANCCAILSAFQGRREQRRSVPWEEARSSNRQKSNCTDRRKGKGSVA